MAYDDIATLGIDIRTEKVQNAIHKLEELQNQSRQTETATQRLARESEMATRSMNGMANGASNISSMMAKAAKSILGVVAAYQALVGVSRMLNTGFQYNEQLEKAQLGIASVIAATMDLADAQGKILEGQEKFTAAQKMSVEMAKALDVASMQSPAGYVDLLSTFQRLLAPATQLGIKWEDTLDVTIKMSNVLSSLGLEMDRLGTETEAILTGKNLTHSQVALRLGITKEELESWGKGEKLIANFQKRFEAFKYAGLAVEDTMEAVREYYNDVLANASGDASTSLWNSMKQSMLEVADAFYVIDEETNKFRKTDEWEALSSVLDRIGEAIGDEMVSATKSLVSAMQGLGNFINERGPEVFFNDLKDGAKIAAAALVALTVARRAASVEIAVGAAEDAKAAAAATANAAAATGSAAAETKRTAGLLGYIAAVRQKVAADIQAAASTQAASTGMLRYQAAVVGATAKTIAFTAASRGAAVASAAFSGLLGMFGGPWGLALTAAATGVAYLATRQDSATRAVEASERAFSSYAEIMRKVKNETGEYTKELDKKTKAELESAQANNTIAQQTAKAELESKLSSLLSSAKRSQLGEDFAGGFGSSIDLSKIIPEEFTSRLEDTLKQFRSGQLESQEFAQRLFELNAAVVQAGYGSTDFSQSLQELTGASDSAINKFLQLIAQGKSLTEALQSVAGAARLASGAVQGLQGVNFGGILEQAKYAKLTAGLKGGDKAFAQALISESHKKGSQLTYEQIEGAVTRGDYSFAGKEGAEQLKATRKLLGEAAAEADSLKSSSGGAAKSIDNAAEKIRQFREEIDQLNGVSSKSTGQLSKKLVEIEKAGKEAKMAAPEIAKLKEEYKEAFQADTLKKFNKELLQLEGRTAELHKLEVAEKMQEWRNQLEGLGLSAEETEQKLAQMQAALNTQSAEKDFQTSINFYRELAEMSGNYTQLMDLQTQAIERQGEAYIRAGIDEHLVRQWEALKKLQESRDPWAGITRGLMKYANDATNLGQQMESAVSNAFTGMEDAFMQFVQTGKLSFTDLANSIITDLMRIAIRAAVLGPLTQGIGSLFSSFIGGGATTYSGSVSFGGGAAASGGANMSGLVGVSLHAKGDVFSGGSLHDYSNSIVTRPTLFGYGSHLTAYAQGAGLMGEAGPEAILPLARTSRGDLGVQVADRSSRGAARDGGPHVTIVINNQTGANVEAQGEMKDDGNGNFNFEILLTQVQQGIVSQAKAGRSPLMNYVDQTRGLSRAGVLQKGRR